MYYLATKVGMPCFVSRILAAIFICGFFSLTSFAQIDVPKTIGYQGQLTSDTGIPISGDQLITITLYADPHSAHVAWQGKYTVPVTNGIFNVQLGKGDYPLPSIDQLNRPMWVGIQVNGSEEMKPLTQLAGVPYALNVPDHSITIDKLAPDVLLGMNTIVVPKPQWIGNNSACPTNLNDDGAQATNTIGGGCGNTTRAGITIATYASIIGGLDNRATGDYSVTAGGDTNLASGNFATVSGGVSNTASTDNSVVAGGKSNTASGPFGDATVSGGEYNSASGSESVVAGGFQNSASGSGSVVSGGDNNIASSPHGYDVISGGSSNSTTEVFSTISGGNLNIASNPGSTVGGGYRNSASGTASVVSGGGSIGTAIFISNSASGDTSVVAGGSSNTASGTNSVVSGGFGNTASGIASVVGGGGDQPQHGITIGNQATGTYSVVSGGKGNIASGNYSVVAGGGGDSQEDLGGGYITTGNKAEGNYSTVTGGVENWAEGIGDVVAGGGVAFGGTMNGNHASNINSVISGGAANRAQNKYSVIAGGFGNTVDGEYAVISGGDVNWATGNHSVVSGGGGNFTLANYSVVAGGMICSTYTAAQYSCIGGGSNNTITSNGINACIPGGNGLIAQSFAQTVIGSFDANTSIGSSTSSSNFMTGTHVNDRLFVIGNGTADNARANAFEVSNNGHSIVYHENTSSVVPFKGATYTDNIIYAWGYVSQTMINDVVGSMGGAGPLSGAFASLGSTFGVSSIKLHKLSSGDFEYIITLNIKDPHTGNSVDLSGACSITVTPAYDAQATGTFSETTASWLATAPNPSSCAMASQMITGNIFKVWVYPVAGTAAIPSAKPFYFKVTGRPQ